MSGRGRRRGRWRGTAAPGGAAARGVGRSGGLGQLDCCLAGRGLRVDPPSLPLHWVAPVDPPLLPSDPAGPCRPGVHAAARFTPNPTAAAAGRRVSAPPLLCFPSPPFLPPRSLSCGRALPPRRRPGTATGGGPSSGRCAPRIRRPPLHGPPPRWRGFQSEAECVIEPAGCPGVGGARHPPPPRAAGPQLRDGWGAPPLRCAPPRLRRV